jgi:outer membrane receptor protein involved in Fe transport
MSWGRSGRALSLLTLLSLAPGLVPGLAAGADSSEPPVTLPPVVVTAPGPLPQPVPREWVPSAVDLLERREIGAGRPAVLPDLLERQPGVTLQNEQGTPFQPTLTLRGFTASPVTGLPQGVSVFLDGVRLNEPTVEELNFDLIPLEDVERIEVIRGASVLFGRNTLGAAVNIVTRRGRGDPRDRPRGRGRQLRPPALPVPRKRRIPAARLLRRAHSHPGGRLPRLHRLPAVARLRQARAPRGRLRWDGLLPVQQRPHHAGRLPAPA